VVVEKYEYLSLFFIKYCNALANKLSKNRLKYSNNGILYNYTTITDKLGEEELNELLGKFNNMEVNIGLNDPILEKLAEVNQFKSLKESFDDIINIVDGLFGKTEIILKKSVNFKPMYPIYNNTRPRMYDNINYRDLSSQAAGTFKNKKGRIQRKTRNKKINKNGTKKRLIKKQSKNTRRN
jgi:hypothetical protein